MDFRSTSPSLKMRLASIDIGTNTILMLIADVDSNGNLSVVRDEHFIARLGKGVDEQGIIQQDTFQRVHDILSQLKSTAEANNVQHIFACGTSALRDAANRQKFIDDIKDQLGIEIRVLSGQEEAELTYLGATSEYLSHVISKEYVVLDIGGGSTELVIGTEDKVTSAVSVDVGSVRLTERIFKTSPPDDMAFENASQWIRNQLQNTPPLTPSTKLIGVGGTLTTLAALDIRLSEFDQDKINRHILKVDAINRIFQELRPLTLEQIRSYPQIHHARADILLAGIFILMETLRKLNLQNITVSVRGLRYGIMIKNAITLKTTSLQ
jgi:exopolyphosphatase / guanosine-5'-triphosphate,3'-diphosphate pyrophosphatase